MVAHRISNFGGMSPRTDPRLLPENGSASTQNYRLTSGVLTPLYRPKLVTTVVPTAPINTIYRMFDGLGNDTWLAFNSDVDISRAPLAGDTSFRLYYTSSAFEPRVTRLDMATSASPYPGAWFEPGATYPTTATYAPFPKQWYALGVTPPVTKSVITPGATTSNLQARAYVYTFVTEWGEESAPSPASVVTTGDSTSNWTVTLPDVAPLNTFTVTAASWSSGTTTYTVASTFGTRVGEWVTITGSSNTAYNVTAQITKVTTTQISVAMVSTPGTFSGTATLSRCAPHHTANMYKRVYRSVNNAYYQVSDDTSPPAIATTTFTDNASTVLGGPCPTIGWAMPPTNLRGLVLHPSGSLIGFAGNTIYCSEPDISYAYPLSYCMTVDYPIVGLGLFGTTLVILTTGVPYVASGVDPASMSAQKITFPWPCMSKRGIVSAGDQVFYPTVEGLASIGINGPELISRQIVRRTEWSAYNPSSFFSTFYAQRYYAVYTPTSGAGGMLVFDIAEGVFSTSDQTPTAGFVDPQTGTLYGVQVYQGSNTVFQWDSDNSGRLAASWKGKQYVVPAPLNLGAAKLDAEFTTSSADAAAIAAANAAIATYNTGLLTSLGAAASGVQSYILKGALNTRPLGPLVLNGSSFKALSNATYDQVNFTLYVDGDIYYSTSVVDTKVFRLPAGQKYDNFQVEVSSNLPIRAVLIAETPTELRTV